MRPLVEGFEHAREILGQGRLEADRLARARLGEDQAPGVQQRPADLERMLALRAVDRIADDRAMNMAQMHANLMRAPGVELELEPGIALVALHDLPVGAREAAVL